MQDLIKVSIKGDLVCLDCGKVMIEGFQGQVKEKKS
jgi:hypothetical protein